MSVRKYRYTPTRGVTGERRKGAGWTGMGWGLQSQVSFYSPQYFNNTNWNSAVHSTSTIKSELSDEVMLNVLGCRLTYYGQTETNAEAWFNKSLRPRKPEGHVDSHTAPEL